MKEMKDPMMDLRTLSLRNKWINKTLEQFREYYNERINMISGVCHEEKQEVFLSDDAGRRLVVLSLSQYEKLMEKGN